MAASEVEFYDLDEHTDALTELAETLTDRQLKHVMRQLRRLNEHGLSLNGDWFKKIETSDIGLWEFRMSADKVEVRFIYRLIEKKFLMLRGFVHKRANDLERHTPIAERRFADWMEKQ